MKTKSLFIFAGLIVAACTSDNGPREQIQKATAYLQNDPTASSTDAMTFNDPGFWHGECKGKTQLWTAAVVACSSEGLHPQVCQIIVNSGNGCP